MRAGLRNARAKGKRLGRPRVIVDARRIAMLRNGGRSWSEICEETGLSKGTAQRAFHGFCALKNQTNQHESEPALWGYAATRGGRHLDKPVKRCNITFKD